MERYIGLDAHASSCTLGIVGPSGKRLGSQVVETNARALIEVLRGIPRNRHLCLEEGTLSGWLYEVLEPHVEELTVAGVGKSRGPKTDKLDAFALAEKLRIGSLETRVYKNRGQFRRLGERAKSYDFLVGDTVRVKNRLKSVLRSRGVAYGGSSPELCVKERGSSSMLRLGCVGDLLRFEKREIEVAAFAPDRSSPQSNRGDEAERTGSVGEGAGAPDPTLDLGVQALEAVRGA